MTKRLYTADELLNMREVHCRLQLIRGELYEREFLGFAGGGATTRLMMSVRDFTKPQKLDVGFVSGTGFHVEFDPDTVLAPNFAYITEERWPKPRRFTHKYCTIVPDLVVETWTPNATKWEVRTQIDYWLRVGVKLAWELNADDHTLTVHRRGMEPRILSVEDELSGEDVLPGFTLSIRKLFREE